MAFRSMIKLVFLSSENMVIVPEVVPSKPNKAMKAQYKKTQKQKNSL